ncbi:hypothetical protein [Thermococcus prieurii]
MRASFVVEASVPEEAVERVSGELRELFKRREEQKKQLEYLYVELLEVTNRLLEKKRLQRLVELTSRKLNRSYTTNLDLPFGEGTADGGCFRINFIGAGSLAIFEFRLDDIYCFFTHLEDVRDRAESVVLEAIESYASNHEELSEWDVSELRHLGEVYFTHVCVVLDAIESSAK